MAEEKLSLADYQVNYYVKSLLIKKRDRAKSGPEERFDQINYVNSPPKR